MAEIYYITQVEDVLFNLHRGLLIRKFVMFKTMFSVPLSQESQLQGVVIEGDDDKHPIMISQVTVKQWEALLEFMYDGYVTIQLKNVSKTR